MLYIKNRFLNKLSVDLSTRIYEMRENIIILEEDIEIVTRESEKKETL